MKFNNLSKIFTNIFFSRLTGLLRDILFANFLGASLISDAFMFAFRLPNLFRRVLAEGAMNSVLIPLYLNQKKKGIEESSQFYSIIFLIFIFITSLLSLLVFFKTDLIVTLFAPGLTLDKEILLFTIDLVRITFPFLIFVTLSALLSSVLNANNSFFIPSFLSVVLNILMIITLIIFKENSHIQLSWSILISGILQIILLLINFKFLKLTFSFSLKFSKFFISAIKKFFFRLLQAIIGAGIVQLNIFVSMIFASLVGTGAISQIYYADRIIDLPFALIAVAISTTLLPYLSKNINDIKKISHAFNQSVIFCLIFAAPSLIGILMISNDIVLTLFGRGMFDDSDVMITSSILSIYAFSLPAYMIARMLNQIFYSYEKVHLPILASIPTFLVNLLLCFLLYKDYGVKGLAFSSVVSVWLNVIIQLVILKYSQPLFYYNLKIIDLNKYFKIFIALVALVLTVLLINYLDFTNKYIDLSLKLVFPGLIYFFSLYLLKLNEIKILFAKYSFN